MNKLLFSILFSILSINAALCLAQEKVKMYVFYTPSHEVLFAKWFLPSIQDDFELVVERHEQDCPSGAFMKEGWFETMLKKVDIIIRGVRENWGKIFIHSDVDVQFFAPIKSKIINLMGNNDMLIQWLDPRGVACPGFLVCKGNEKTLKLWLEVKERMMRDHRKNDQDHLNDIIRAEGYKGIIWDYLPIEFFSAGALEKRSWVPGLDLKLPATIVLHHATYTAGVANKIAQFAYVREKFKKQQK